MKVRALVEVGDERATTELSCCKMLSQCCSDCQDCEKTRGLLMERDMPLSHRRCRGVRGRGEGEGDRLLLLLSRSEGEGEGDTSLSLLSCRHRGRHMVVAVDIVGIIIVARASEHWHH